MIKIATASGVTSWENKEREMRTETQGRGRLAKKQCFASQTSHKSHTHSTERENLKDQSALKCCEMTDCEWQ